MVDDGMVVPPNRKTIIICECSGTIIEHHTHTAAAGYLDKKNTIKSICIRCERANASCPLRMGIFTVKIIFLLENWFPLYTIRTHSLLSTRKCLYRAEAAYLLYHQYHHWSYLQSSKVVFDAFWHSFSWGEREQERYILQRAPFIYSCDTLTHTNHRLLSFAAFEWHSHTNASALFKWTFNWTTIFCEIIEWTNGDSTNGAIFGCIWI